MSSMVLITDENIKKQLEQLARMTGKPVETVASEVMETGLQNYPAKEANAAKALLELAQWAEENDVRGPKDLSTNLDTYLWEDANPTDE